MSDNKKTVVLLRGGIDSSVCLAQAVEDFGKDKVIALNLYYGEERKKEREAARRIAEYYRVEYIELDISNTVDGIKKDIPFKNGLMISTAASVALSKGAGSIQFAVHSDESAGHARPDCRESFYRTMATAINEGTDGELKLVLPFTDMSKKQVMMLGMKLGVPFVHTWSCYKSKEKPCGKCLGCEGRAKAFALIDEEDPLLK